MSVTQYTGKESSYTLVQLLESLPIEDQVTILFENDPVLRVLLILKKSFETIKEHFTIALSTFSPCTLITKADHPALASWLSEILICRSLFQKTLSPADFGTGLSKGVLYTIKIMGEVVGYLFGTIHRLTPEKAHIINLTPKVLKKLDKCPVLLTEIKHSPTDISVEKALTNFTRKRGISQFGIDDVHFRESVQNCPIEECETTPTETEAKIWENYQEAYYNGDIKSLEENPLSSVAEEPQTANLRNRTMSSHISAFITTGLSKIFAAVGTNHLINTDPAVETIPTLLEADGYEVTLVVLNKNSWSNF